MYARFGAGKSVQECVVVLAVAALSWDLVVCSRGLTTYELWWSLYEKRCMRELGERAQYESYESTVGVALMGTAD